MMNKKNFDFFYKSYNKRSQKVYEQVSKSFDHLQLNIH